jgi:hypothetical protein
VTREIPLTQGKVAIVDDEDYEQLAQYKWTYLSGRKTGYAMRFAKVDEKRVLVLMHRFILSAPDGTEVDHRDRNGLNNTRDNIRIATPSQNRVNAPKRNGKCSSQFKGVVRSSNSSRPWEAIIKVGHKAMSLGYFASEQDAACAYNYAAVEYYGEFAYVNDIPGWREQPCPQSAKGERCKHSRGSPHARQTTVYWWTAYLIAA